MTKTQSSIGKHPLLTLTNNFLSFDVQCVFQSSSFICLQSWMHTRFNFWLKDQYLASFSRLSVEHEVRSLLIAKIQRYCFGKNARFLSHSDLDLQKIDPFLYGSISFMIMYQYQYVVRSDKLNYGTVGTCLRIGFWISITEFEGTTTRLERKWRQLYMKLFENDNSNTPAMWNEDNYWRTFFHRKIKQSSYSFSVHMLFCNTPHMLNGGSIPLPFGRKPEFCE